MPNKKIKKSKLEYKGMFKKGLALFLAFTMIIVSSFIFFIPGSEVKANETILREKYAQSIVSDDGKIEEFKRLGYFNDTDMYNQTRIMMDGDNFLKCGYWMNAIITPTGTGENANAPFNAKLRFIIPGYDTSRLRFYVLNKDASLPIETKEYKLSTSTQCCIPSLCLSGLSATSYEVHVYLDGLIKENFIAKAEFSCVPYYGGWGICSDNGIPLLDACGNQINSAQWGPLRIAAAKPYNNRLGPHQYLIAFPIDNLVPYYARTVKLVFFASDRNGEPVNIDKTCYDYIYRAKIFGDSGPEFLVFAPDAQWGTDPSIEYEAHFYVDEVREGNFIAKAVGITNTAP